MGVAFKVLNTLRRWIKSARGNTTVVTAVVAMPMVLVIGGGVDFGRVISARARLQDAADTAALAGALYATASLNTQKDQADKAFAANLQGTELEGEMGALSPVTENNVLTFTYEAHADVPTILLGIIGMDSVPVDVVAKAGTTLNSAEIVFVLDTTGSMSQSDKMTQLKSSMDSVLASLLDSSGQNSGRTKVAIVPFDTQVALDNVSDMSGYVGDFTNVSNVYSCTNLSTAQCDAVTSARTSLCNAMASSYGSGVSADCLSNADIYTRTNYGTYYVYVSTYFNNPYYTGCWRYCYSYQSNRYIHYYRVQGYSLGTSSASSSGNASSGGYYSNSAYAPSASQAGYGYSYSQYSGTITYAPPSAGGYSSGNTTDIKDNDTITANSDLLGVGTNNWSGCVIDRTQPYDAQPTAPTTSNTATLYPAAKCATNSLLPILPLTTDISAARAHVQKLKPSGNTNITIGVQWGMEVLSNTAPFSTGASFDDTTVSKYMIIVTDGLNTQNRWTTNSSDIDLRTAEACRQARAKNITVFTMRVMAGNSTMLSACASKTDYYYNLTNANQINGALGSIMKSIKKIRLTR